MFGSIEKWILVRVCICEMADDRNRNQAWDQPLKRSLTLCMFDTSSRRLIVKQNKVCFASQSGNGFGFFASTFDATHITSHAHKCMHSVYIYIQTQSLRIPVLDACTRMQAKRRSIRSWTQVASAYGRNCLLITFRWEVEPTLHTMWYDPGRGV